MIARLAVRLGALVLGLLGLAGGARAFDYVSYELLVEQSPPGVCLGFSEALPRARQAELAPFVAIEPPLDLVELGTAGRAPPASPSSFWPRSTTSLGSSAAGAGKPRPSCATRWSAAARSNSTHPVAAGSRST